jgi:3'-phosphoadenosine 5'-phosphosulfate sulfotransferase (PAPS reductase)/FAD synthetase
MKDQAKELVEAKKAAVKDSLQAVKNQVKEEVKQEVKNQIAKQLLGQKDSTATKDSARNVKQEAVDKGKNIIKGLFKKN